MSGSKTTTSTTSSEPWDAAQPALKLGLADAQELYKSGVGSQPYTGSTVVPYSGQTTEAMGWQELGSRQALPAMWTQFGAVNANALNGGLNDLQKGSVGALKNLQQPGRGMAGLSDIQSNAYGVLQGIAANPAKDGTSAFNDVQKNAYGLYQGMAAKPVATGLDALNDAQRASYSNYQGLANTPVQTGSNALNDVQKGALSQLQSLAGGAEMNGNPYLDQVISNASRDMGDSINLSASGMGRYGSGVHQGVLSKNIGNMSADLRFNDYNNQLGRKDAALQGVMGMGNQADAQSQAAYGRQLHGMDQMTNLGNQANAQTQDAYARQIHGIDNMNAMGNQARSQFEADRNNQNAALQGMIGLGDRADANYESGMGRWMDAQGSLFNAGQQQQQNLWNNTQQLGNAFNLMNQPAETMMNVGGMNEDLYGRTLNDQLRLHNATQNAPWEQLARLNGVASGAGQMGGSEQERAQGPSRLMSGAGGALSGFDSTGSLWGGLLGGAAGLFG
jgi:hypothetical protein